MVKKLTLILIISILTTPLLVPSANTSPIQSQASSQNVRSSGRISYSYPTEKRITWADGSRETLSVDESGHILLDGKRTIAFGLNIATMQGTNQEDIANKVLDALQRGGVRFMTLDIAGWFDVNGGLAWMNFWMPKLYQHKMWTDLSIYEDSTQNFVPTLDVSAASARISSIINGINNQNWADMIFAVGYTAELDLSSYNFTNDQVETYLSKLYPPVKLTVDTSIIGSVPILGRHSATSSQCGTVQIVKYSDIPNWDFYYGLPDWKTYYDQRLQEYHQKTLVSAGKAGVSIWYGDTGAMINGQAGMDQYTTEMLQYLWNGGGYNDTSAMFLWVLQWNQPYGFAAFDTNGNAKPWFTNILNYYSSFL